MCRSEQICMLVGALIEERALVILYLNEAERGELIGILLEPGEICFALWRRFYALQFYI